MLTNHHDPTDIQLDELETTKHSYKQKKLGCPCPGISILVNHGYLNLRDQHDRIQVGQLINALVECFNLTWFHAAFLSIIAVLVCGKGLSMSISELGLHGPIEHDGSITRYDSAVGDSLNPDEKLIDQFLKTKSGPRLVSLNDYAVRRAELASLARQPFSWKTRLLGPGEVGLVFSLFGNKQQTIDSSILESIYRQERLPKGWRKSKKSISMLDVIKISANLNQKIKFYSKMKKGQAIQAS